MMYIFKEPGSNLTWKISYGNQSPPDYDYSAKVVVDGNAYVFDPDELLGTYSTSEPVFRGAHLTALLVVPADDTVVEYIIERGRFTAFKVRIFVAEHQGQFRVHAHARRYVEYNKEEYPQQFPTLADSTEKFRTAWNADMPFFPPERGVYSEITPLWKYPNFYLLLNGEDGTNLYGGSYSDGSGFHEDDDYAILTATLKAGQTTVDEDTTKSWHSVGAPVHAATDNAKTLNHVAGSSLLSVGTLANGTLEITLSYAEDNVNYGTVRLPVVNGEISGPPVIDLP